MDRIERIYIARHGFKPSWQSSDWTTPTNLPRDPPLTGLGITQAKELAEYFKSMPPDERPTAIFSSPAYRCLQTATPVAQQLNIPLYVEHGITEWLTPVVPGTGRHPRPTDATYLKQHVPLVDPSWKSTWLASRSGETTAELYERTRGFLEAFVPRVEFTLSGHQRILLIGHAATVISLVHSLIGENVPLRVGYATLTVLDRASTGDDVVGAWKPVGTLASGEFLSGGVQRDWGIEDEAMGNKEVVLEHGEPVTDWDIDTAIGLQWHPSNSKM
ncbi:PGAM-domain-containing protein [Auriculariales sp. MPI-PUGE-AT-0066]|nr:PGAM-domain-containing protein [Auriculariales sp. MPI-PUGE-AT-0066]